MPGLCLNSWPTGAPNWSVGCIWRSSDYVERTIFIVLALMLAYTLFVVGRFLILYYKHSPRLHTFSPDPAQTQRNYRTIVAELSRGLGTVKAISSLAPFLGLAGTCYGITGGVFIGFGLLKSLAELILMTNTAAALVTTAAGILVAIPATVSYSILSSRVQALADRAKRDRAFGSSKDFRFAQTLPLKSQFSRMPAFAVIATPTLASVISIWMAFEPYETPTGLPVRLPSTRCVHHGDDRLLVLRVDEKGKLHLNNEPEEWKDLPGVLSNIYSNKKCRTLYLLAGEGASFQTVAEAIDVARSSLGPGQMSPDLTVMLITPRAETESESCIAPVRTNAAHFSR